MSIPVIDTLSALGNFPLVNDSDVQCGGKRLNEKLQSIPTKTSQLTNDSGFLTQHQDISGKADVASVNELANRVTDNESNISAQTARIDSIVALPEGSTTGDAELIDIRVASDGTTYSDAGTAVRTQISKLNNEINKYSTVYTNKNIIISESGEITQDFYFIKGHSYVLLNKTSNTIAVSIIKSGGGSQSVTEGLATNQGVTFTVNEESTKIYIYSNGTGYVNVVDEDSEISKINGDISTIESNVEDLQNDVVNFYNLYNDKKITVSSGFTYSNYKLSSNRTYAFFNNTTDTVAAWVYKNGESVYEITGGLSAGEGCSFSTTSNGDQIVVYTSGSGTVEISDTESAIGEIRKNVSEIDDKIIVGKNKFNKYETVDGYFLAYNTGNPNVNASFCYTSYYVPIKPSTVYYMSGLGSHICFYDDNKSYVNGFTSAAVHTFTTPNNATYMRVSINKSTKDEFYIVEGNSSAPYEPFIFKFKYDVKPKNYVVVAKDGSGDFTSVETASEQSPDGTVIYVMPGIYDNEIVRGTWSKKQYIIGTSAQDCIIKNSLGDYSYPPIQIGAGYLENLTFYSEYTGTQTRGTGETMSYAVHTESDTLSNENLTIKNCILKSDYAPAFGMGMRGGCNVIIDNCTLINTYNDDGLLFHDADNETYAGIQNITVKDSTIYAPNGNSEAVRLQSQGRTGTIVNVEMIRNRFKCKNSNKSYGTLNYYGGTPSSDDFLGLINYRLKETSWGNSESAFNKD